ncbi:serine/arginine repetitive matrix protein 2-like [Onychomys torridus]|uniref:serine/arginine repetitive matrix protein 2-like n=1 Tax=Onychomys torridus TaxID=38674 RepID=UPI00167FD79F|nr:serine/arginine repetitive matrix protein 2-like [Onychomys torridus]
MLCTDPVERAQGERSGRELGMGGLLQVLSTEKQGARARRVPLTPEGQGAVGHRSRAIPTWPRRRRGPRNLAAPAPPAARPPARPPSAAPTSRPASRGGRRPAPRGSESRRRRRRRRRVPWGRGRATSARRVGRTKRRRRRWRRWRRRELFLRVCSALPRATTYRGGLRRKVRARRRPSASASASARVPEQEPAARLARTSHDPARPLARLLAHPPARPRPFLPPAPLPPSPSRLQAGGRGAGARGRGRAARAGPAGSCSFPPLPRRRRRRRRCALRRVRLPRGKGERERERRGGLGRERRGSAPLGSPTSSSSSRAGDRRARVPERLEGGTRGTRTPLCYPLGRRWRSGARERVGARVGGWGEPPETRCPGVEDRVCAVSLLLQSSPSGVAPRWPRSPRTASGRSQSPSPAAQ